MVRLKNIAIRDTVIECDIYPEDSAQPGQISVDMKSKKLIAFKLPAGYEYCRNHVEHAKDNLVSFIGKNDIPEEKLMMWY